MIRLLAYDKTYGRGLVKIDEEVFLVTPPYRDLIGVPKNHLERVWTDGGFERSEETFRFISEVYGYLRPAASV